MALTELPIVVLAWLASVPRAEHLVVAPRAMVAALRPYLEHRRSASPHLDGSALVTLEAALAMGEGRDDAEKLKRFLFERWRSAGTRSCLLVGDCDVMPMRSMTLDRATEPAFHWAFYPCDLYYADVARGDGLISERSFDDWNGATEGFHAEYFGEVHGESIKSDPINFDRIDYRPDVAIGRWPASTVADVEAMAAKTIAFETSAAEAPMAAFFAVGGWVDVRDRVKGLAERLHATHEVRTFLHDTADSPAPDQESMRATLAAHPRWIFHTGHGQPLGYEGCLSLETLKGIEQGAALPIFVSAGCSTSEVMTQAPYQAYVDRAGALHKGTNAGEIFTSPPPAPSVYQRGECNSTSIAESLMRTPAAGAVATIGCVTGSQPAAVSLIDGLTESIASGATTLGACWNGAIRRYCDIERIDELKPTDDWYPPSIYFQGMKFVLLGDPGLRVR